MQKYPNNIGKDDMVLSHKVVFNLIALYVWHQHHSNPLTQSYLVLNDIAGLEYC